MTPASPASQEASRPGAPSSGADPRIDLLIDAVTRLADSQKTILQSLQPVEAQSSTGGASSAGVDVRRVVSEVLRERDASAQRSASRDRYVRQRMGDLPEAYRRQMPETDDEQALANHEREIRGQFREDFRSIGKSLPDVGGDPASGRQPGDAIDYSSFSPLQQITLGLRDAPSPQSINMPGGKRESSDVDSPVKPGGMPPAKPAPAPLSHGAD